MRRAFTLELGTVELQIEDIWPDGDAPENPTAQDVADLIMKCGGPWAVMTDWALVDGIEVWSGRDRAVAR